MSVSVDRVKSVRHENLEYYFADASNSGFPPQSSFAALFSTKHGGVSVGKDLASMNLGFDRGDKLENVIKNYEIITDELGFDFSSTYALKQTHSDHIIKIDNSNKDKTTIAEHFGFLAGKRGCNDFYIGDAMITNLRGILMSIRIADCVPVVFYDGASNCAGISHCGWRGTKSGLAVKTMKALIREYGAASGNIKVFIGAAVGGCCYHVGKELLDAFRIDMGSWTKDYFLSENGKLTCDLKNINKAALLAAGIREDNILVSPDCTCCKEEDYYSHRRTGLQRGSMAAFAGIK